MNRTHYHVSLSLLVAIVLSAVYSPATLRAQAVKVNIDRKTVQAMTAAFTAGALVEDMYLNQNSTILQNYTNAEVAAAVIFASKMLDRKAMSTLGVWTDPTENYYYRRIYNLVGRKLMPKIWTVAQLMLRRPAQALYWGSYLYKVCAEIQSLCYQFESVVTNSTLSFRDIAFLSISPELQPLFDPQQLGGFDWNVAIDRLFEFLGNYSQGTLLGDLDALYQKASSISAITSETLTDQLLSASSFKEYASQGLFELIEVIDHYFQVYESLEKEISLILKSKTGNSHDPSSLFSLASYNLNEWLSDYLEASKTMYYTQRWDIVRFGGIQEEIYHQYFPPLDLNSVKYSSQWYRIATSNPSYRPTPSELDRIRENSERYSGYSQKKIDQMNQEQSQSSSSNGSARYYYTINYSLCNYSVYEGGNHTAKAFAYSINVNRRTENVESVYSAVYDSAVEPIEMFKGRMLQQLRALEQQFPDATFKMISDAPCYYAATDERKIKGVETVVISASCSDHVDLASGVSQYKCKECGSSVNAHTKQCAMSTSIAPSTDNESDQLQSMADDYQSQIEQLQQEIIQLQAQGEQLLQQIGEIDPEDTREIKRLKDLYAENYQTQQQKHLQIKELNKKLEDVSKAQEELDQDTSEEDDYNRIPSIMDQLRSVFGVQWNQDGHWSGNTYIVTGKCGSLTKDVTLRVNLSIERGPKYFMGVKIHRAIVKLDWSLTGNYSDSQIVDIIELDETMTDAEKAQLVNEHISQASQDFAGCSIVTEYVQREPVEADNTDDSYHLLWASDRLDIARMVETRLTNIYANLVCMEKFMHYKLTLVDVIRAVAPSVYDAYQHSERIQTICTESFERWRQAANLQGRRKETE